MDRATFDKIVNKRQITQTGFIDGNNELIESMQEKSVEDLVKDGIITAVGVAETPEEPEQEEIIVPEDPGTDIEDDGTDVDVNVGLETPGEEENWDDEIDLENDAIEAPEAEIDLDEGVSVDPIA